MKMQTREAVKKSMMRIDKSIHGGVATDKLYSDEKLSDQEFKERVEKLSADIIREIEQAKKRYYEEGFKAAQEKFKEGLEEGKEPAVSYEAGEQVSQGNEEATTTGQMISQLDKDLRNAEHGISTKIDELIAAQNHRRASIDELEHKLSREIREEKAEALEEHRALLASANGKYKKISEAKEELERLSQRVQELHSRLDDQSNAIFNLQLAKENSAKTLDAMQGSLEEMGKGISSAGTADEEKVTGMIFDNTTKINSALKLMGSLSKRLNKRVSTQNKKLDEYRKKRVTKKVFRRSIDSAKKLSEKRPSKKAARKTAKKSAAEQKPKKAGKK